MKGVSTILKLLLWFSMSLSNLTLPLEELKYAVFAPNTVQAEAEDGNAVSGSCSEKDGDLIWVLDVDGTLTISRPDTSESGEMRNYAPNSNPWYLNRERIKKVVLEEGVTSIGNYAFSCCESLTSVTIPNGITSIGSNPFSYCVNLTSIDVTAGNSQFTSVTKIYIYEESGGTISVRYEFSKGGSTREVSPEDVEKGDVNFDGEISVEDAQLALKQYTAAVAGKPGILPEDNQSKMDVSGDGDLSVDDAQYILMYYTQKTVAQKDITWEDLLNRSKT